MSEMEQIIKDLNSAVAAISDVVEKLNRQFSDKAESKEQAQNLKLEDVRAVLAEKSRAGYSTDIKKLLKKYGADRLSDISQDKYGDLLADAEVLGNG